MAKRNVWKRIPLLMQWVARKPSGKEIKENILQCYIDYYKIILMKKGAGQNTSIHKLYTEIRNVIPKHEDLMT